MTGMEITSSQAATATRTVLVGNVRGARQHLISETVSTFTSLASVRTGHRPVCGQRSRRWRAAGGADPRPLCRRCLGWALRQAPDLPQRPYLTATPQQIHAALLAVTDPDELHRLVMAVCSRRDLLHHMLRDSRGYQQRLTYYVSAARERCVQHARRIT